MNVDFVLGPADHARRIWHKSFDYLMSANVRNFKTALKYLLFLPYKFSLLHGCRVGIFFITVSEKAGPARVCWSCKKIGRLIYICNIDVLKRADGRVE